MELLSPYKGVDKILGYDTLQLEDENDPTVQEFLFLLFLYHSSEEFGSFELI